MGSRNWNKNGYYSGIQTILQYYPLLHSIFLIFKLKISFVFNVLLIIQVLERTKDPPHCLIRYSTQTAKIWRRHQSRRTLFECRMWSRGDQASTVIPSTIECAAVCMMPACVALASEEDSTSEPDDTSSTPTSVTNDTEYDVHWNLIITLVLRVFVFHEISVITE